MGLDRGYIGGQIGGQIRGPTLVQEVPLLGGQIGG